MARKNTKLKFKRYESETGDYYEKNLRCGKMDCYILIAQAGEGKSSYYMIDYIFGDGTEQIRDKKIKTKQQALNRIKSEVKKYYQDVLNDLDNLKIAK